MLCMRAAKGSSQSAVAWPSMFGRRSIGQLSTHLSSLASASPILLRASTVDNFVAPRLKSEELMCESSWQMLIKHSNKLRGG